MPIYKDSQKIRDTGSAFSVYKRSQPIRAIYKGSQLLYWQQITRTFNASNSFQTYIVPAHVRRLQVDCVASRGWTNNTPGKGGRVQCELTVIPGQTLYIMVGIIPTANNNSTYNASDIRTNNAGITNTTSLNSRLIVAGGGGSSGPGDGGVGGNGGGITGANGGNNGKGTAGGGGSQTAGGSAGSGTVYPSSGQAGSFGLGGQATGGAGGAGWYGGGSGGSGSYGDTDYGGGGGGSSYTNSSVCSNVVHTQGYRNGAGYITITEIG